MRDVRDPWFWARTPTGYDSNVCLEYLIILYFTYLVTYLNNFLILLANLFTLLFFNPRNFKINDVPVVL